jgi:hypothetical protein
MTARKTTTTGDGRLTDLPGVGKSIAQDLLALGYRRPADLAGEDPEAMYRAWMRQSGVPERCMLYVFRCAVYCAETPEPARDPELAKWWNWKDAKETHRG